MISDCKLECNVIIYFRKENYHLIFVIAPCIIIMIVVFFVVMSEDMVKDGYEDIMNIDISPVAIDMMRKKYENIPQLKCILFS